MTTFDSSWKGTEEHFVKAHGEFRERTQEKIHLTQALQTYLPHAITESMSDSVYAEGVNILSIGSGDGAIDIEILKIVFNELARKFPSLNPVKLFTRAIEPQENHLQLYRAKAETLRQELAGRAQLAFDLDKPKIFDDYVLEKKDPVPFHIVHFIHSAYFVDDLEKGLEYCYDHELASKGIMMLILSEKDLNEKVIRAKNGFPEEEGKIGREVSRIAHKHGWQYEVYNTEFSVDVTDLFDGNSTNGNLALDFLTYTMDFRASSKQETVKAVLEAIKSTSTNTNGKIMSKVLNRIHFIFKN